MKVAWIDTVSAEDADEELTELYDSARDPVSGQLDHILEVHSHHPAGMRAHLALYTAVMRGTRGLRRVDREMIAMVVSRLNECHY
jgi:alkylhydroperoxidase family enzyme